MTARLGVYWGPEHQEESYKAHLTAIGGPVRILEPDVQQIVDAGVRTPDEIWPRWWRLDDNNYKVLDAMVADPEGSGERLALAMIQERDKMRQQAQERGLPFPEDHRFRFSGINEPPVWTDARDEFIRHEVRFLDTLTAHNAKSLAMRLGVGHPADLDEEGLPIWEPYLPIYEAIQRANQRQADLCYLELHEYWYWTGPWEGWGWYAGRHWKCPWDVPMAIGEAGIDNFVDSARWNSEKHRARGWQGNVSAQEYINHFDWYWRNLDHSRVKVVLPYMFDYRDNHWASFDIYPAKHDFEAWWARTRHQEMPAKKNPFVTYLPKVEGKPEKSPSVREENRQSGPIENKGDDVSKQESLAWWFVGQMGRVLGIDGDLAQAFLEVESGIRYGQEIPDDKMIIRFEPHIFRPYVDAATFDRHFQIGSPQWDGSQHRFRQSPADPWQVFHGNQAKEWEVLRLAASYNEEGAYRSISMGAGQIMGFNHRLVGYNSAKEMFEAYTDPERGDLAQIVGFYAYCVNRPGLLEALRVKDFDKMAELYNGTGQVSYYSRLIREAYERVNRR